MKMDRNLNPSGLGKYAVIRLRGINDHEHRHEILDAMTTLERAGVIDYGIAGQPDEFFLVRLKDVHAEAALRAYAADVRNDQFGDGEWASEVEALAERAGYNSPFSKRPD